MYNRYITPDNIQTAPSEPPLLPSTSNIDLTPVVSLKKTTEKLLSATLNADDLLVIVLLVLLMHHESKCFEPLTCLMAIATYILMD